MHALENSRADVSEEEERDMVSRKRVEVSGVVCKFTSVLGSYLDSVPGGMTGRLAVGSGLGGCKRWEGNGVS